MLIVAVLDSGTIYGTQGPVPVQPSPGLIASTQGGADGLIRQSGFATPLPEHIGGRVYEESPENSFAPYKTETRSGMALALTAGK
jgi:hypothetical protein